MSPRVTPHHRDRPGKVSINYSQSLAVSAVIKFNTVRGVRCQPQHTPLAFRHYGGPGGCGIPRPGWEQSRAVKSTGDLSLCPALFSFSHNRMEYLRKLRLPKKGKFLTAIMNKKGLIKPSKWKVSRRIIREASRPWLTGSRTVSRLEAGLEGQEDSFLAREILQQINNSHHHLLHQKKSLKSVIEEAKAELTGKKLQLILPSRKTR